MTIESLYHVSCQPVRMCACGAYGQVGVGADGTVIVTGVGDGPAVATAKVPAATIGLTWAISPGVNLMFMGTAFSVFWIRAVSSTRPSIRPMAASAPAATTKGMTRFV